MRTEVPGCGGGREEGTGGFCLSAEDDARKRSKRKMRPGF